MNAWWQLYQAHFTPAECQAFIDYGLTHPVRQATVGSTGKSQVNETIRRAKVRWLRREDPALFLLYARLTNLAIQSNNNAFGFDLREFTEVQFTEYDAGDEGHHDWHEDNAWTSGLTSERKMSMVLQLSAPTAYEGGLLELQRDPLPEGLFAPQGSVIFFPAFNRHRVTPVTAGKRYSLVTWFKGPAFR